MADGPPAEPPAAAPAGEAAVPAAAPEPVRMPENAYRELREGEEYRPIVSADAQVPEITARSVGFGIANAIFWSAAVAYLTLKLGQGLEAAIPIAILAIGYSAMKKRPSSLLENVNVMAFGATSGIVVGGSLFVMPAIHILGLQDLSSFFQIFFVPLLGAALGVLFLIPLRRYFVKDMHGKLPFPEGTATAEVLVTGAQGGKQARVLLAAMGLGFVFDTLPTMLAAWRENFTTASLTFLSDFTARTKAVFALNTTAAIAGLGYLIGVRYAAYIMAGSLLSYAVIVPMFGFVAQYAPHTVIGVGVPELGAMDAETLFTEYARYIGIGGIFMAGLVSILKMLPVMGQALKEGAKGLFAGRSIDLGEVPRHDQDIPMPAVLGMIFAVLVATWVYFRFAVLADQAAPTAMSTFAVAIALVISLLFSAVSAWAVAMISVTPISGMTLMTLIVGAVALRWLGLTGRAGMLGVLLIGGVVCTCLSMTGTLVTEFKVSYWLGATPRKVQWSNLAGSVVSALMVTAVMLLLAWVYGFERNALHPNALPAPQANAMAAVLKFIMETGDPSKWYLLAFGGAIALVVELLGVSSLAFALGMYIPMEYNSPILLGALVAHYVRKSSKDEVLNRARGDRGILVSSGLIAGGALAGVLAALVQFVESDLLCRAWVEQHWPSLFKATLPRVPDVVAGIGAWFASGTKEEVARGVKEWFAKSDVPSWLGLVMFVGICLYIYFDSRRATREDAGPSLQT